MIIRAEPMPYRLAGAVGFTGQTWAVDGRKVDRQAAGGTLNSTSTGDGLNPFLNPGGERDMEMFIAKLASGGGTANLQDAIHTIMTIPTPQTWTILGGGLTLSIALRRMPRPTR